MSKTVNPYINPKTGERWMYYLPDGTGTDDTLAWANYIEPRRRVDWRKVKYVKQERVCFGLFWVSTVYLGLDHYYGVDKNHPPLIYESMVFCRFPIPRVRKLVGYWWGKLKRLRGIKIKDKVITFTLTQDRYDKIIDDSPLFKPEFIEYCDELDMQRYSTRKEALIGHKAMAKNWSHIKHLDGHLIKHLFSRW